MIEWLRRQPGSSPFLITNDRVWSYAEMAKAVAERMADEPRVIRPGLDPDSVIEVLAGIAGGGAMVMPPEDELASLASPSTSPRAVGPPTSWGTNETRLVVFTSGSTGSPKGVRLTMANLEAASRASVEHLGHGLEDTWLLALPIHHVGGLSILVRSAYAGGSVLLTESFDPVALAGAMKGRVSMASLVAAMLLRVLNHDPGPYVGLKAVLIGGGPIPDGLLEKAVHAGIPALPSYGMTETFGQMATLRPGSPAQRKVHPLPGVELRIETDGRIAVAADQVSPGYLDEPPRPSRWLVTNDLGEIDDDGALVVTGRADTIVVTGGVNVDPARVEAELATHPGVGEVMVLGVASDEWGMMLACVHSGPATAVELTDWLRGRLPGQMVPKRWVSVSRIPRTPLGKPDRTAAVALCLGGQGS